MGLGPGNGLGRNYLGTVLDGKEDGNSVAAPDDSFQNSTGRSLGRRDLFFPRTADLHHGAHLGVSFVRKGHRHEISLGEL